MYPLNIMTITLIFYVLHVFHMFQISYKYPESTDEISKISHYDFNHP